MLIDTRNSRLTLDHRTLARLDHARGVRLRCVSGEVWITIDGDPRDIVLETGEAFVVDSQRHVIAYALHGRATLDICAGATPSSSRPQTLWHRLLAAFSSAGDRVVAVTT